MAGSEYEVELFGSDVQWQEQTASGSGAGAGSTTGNSVSGSGGVSVSGSVSGSGTCPHPGCNVIARHMCFNSHHMAAEHSHIDELYGGQAVPCPDHCKFCGHACSVCTS